MGKLLSNHFSQAEALTSPLIKEAGESRRQFQALTRFPDLRCRHRTANGLMIYFCLLVLVPLLSASSASSSKGQDCTPVFSGDQLGVPSDPPGIVKVLEGSSFNLSCALSQHYNFEWRLNQNATPLQDWRVFEYSKSKAINGIITFGLIVRNVNRNHSGDYTCILTGCQDQSPPHHGLTIKVIYAQKPKIHHPNAEAAGTYNDVVGELGEAFNITCVIEGNDEILGFTWQKEINRREDDTVGASEGWLNMADVCKEVEETGQRCTVERTTEKQTTNLTLSIKRLKKSDLGRYSCGKPVKNFSPKASVGEWANNDFIFLRDTGRGRRQKRRAGARDEGLTSNPAKTFLGDHGNETATVKRKFPKGTNSTIGWEGDPSALFCNLTRGISGRFTAMWRLKANGTLIPGSEVKDMSTRYTYTENANLTYIGINNLTRDDSGWYQCALWDTHCSLVYNATAFPTCVAATYEIQLRVKDKSDQIYPLVAIGIEVVLLFIIILVYEKRKSKTEVEESDTDGSPDQKNVSENNGESVSEATRLAKD